MVFQSSSTLLFVVAFILGITASKACKIADLSKCMESLSGLKFENLKDGCDAITNAKNCLTGLLEGGSCGADIEGMINSNMGTITTLEDACNMATEKEAVECTANGIIKCSKPVKAAAEDKLNKETLCNAWKISKPCLEAISDTCKNKRWIAKSAKAAVKTFNSVAKVC